MPSNQTYDLRAENRRYTSRQTASSSVNTERRQEERRKPETIPLAFYVKQAVSQYYKQLDGHDPVSLYALMLQEVEKPFLLAALEQSDYNQTKAAKAVGLSRSTLRKKMEQYHL